MYGQISFTFGIKVKCTRENISVHPEETKSLNVIYGDYGNSWTDFTKFLSPNFCLQIFVLYIRDYTFT